MAFMQGFRSGKRGRALGGLQDLLESVNRQAASQSLAATGRERALTKRAGRLRDILPGFQRGDSDAEAMMVAMGLAPAPETDVARRRRTRQEEREAARDTRADEAFTFRKTEAEAAKERDAARIEREAGREEVRVSERGEDIERVTTARTKAETKADKARERTIEHHRSQGRSIEEATQLADMGAAGTAAAAGDERRRERAEAKQDRDELRDISELAAKRDAVTMQKRYGTRFMTWGEVDEYLKTRGVTVKPTDTSRRAQEREDLAAAERTAADVAKATGAKKKDVLRDMLKVRKPEAESTVPDVAGYTLDYKALEANPEAQAAFVRQLISRAKAGDKAAEAFLSRAGR